MTEPEKLDLRSHDIAEDKRQELLRLFPEIRTEGDKIDFERLKLTLSEIVDVGKERYGMNWPGKADCFKTIQSPSLGTLLPCREESINFDTTENLIIEGDNLEVLKLLQKSYLGKVKMIYIDPPYNTGNDFIYPDNYTESLQTYLEYTGQVDVQGKKFSTNTEADGRFHSKWLNMMYPRLYLARNLLHEDGVIFISIDDNEVSNLRKLCDEIFGEENFVNLIAVKMSEATGVKMAHVEKRLPKLKEYLVLYKRAEGQLTPTPVPKGNWDREYRHLICGVTREEIARLKSIMDAEDIPSDSVREADEICSKLLLRPINQLYSECNAISDQEKTSALFNNSWRIVRDVATTGGAKILADQKKRQTSSPFFIIITPQKKAYLIKRDYSDDADQPRIKLLFADDYLTQNPGDFWQDIKTTGLDSEGEIDFRNGKKPLKMVERMLQATTDKSDIVLDFFAGSGTTAQAVLELNREDNGNRKFILVQLPEPTDRKDYPTIADITKERVRRVIQKLNKEDDGKLPLNGNQKPDRGFRVLKLAESNFKTWNANVPTGDVSALQQQLELHIDHIRDGRTAEDILYEILLKSGFPLTTPVEVIELPLHPVPFPLGEREPNTAGKTVYSVANGALFICLERELTLDLIRAMAEQKPERVVCLDSGFANNDQLKANAVQIFKTKGVTSFRTV